MTRYLVSTCAAALLAVAGSAYAQSPGGEGEAGKSPGASSGTGMKQAPSGGPAARTEPSPSGSGMSPPGGAAKGGDRRAQSDTKGDMKSGGPAGRKAGQETQKTGQKGQDTQKGQGAQKSKEGKAKSSANDDGAARQKKARDEGGRTDGKPGEKSAQSKTGDRTDKSGDKSGKQAGGKNGMRSQEGAGETGKSSTAAGASGAASGGATERVQINEQQRTQVRTVFSKHREAAVRRDVDVNVRIGVAVPRSLQLVTIPQDVVVVVPQYRNYRYFVVGDRVVIVDPDTFVIVDVITLA